MTDRREKILNQEHRKFVEGEGLSSIHTKDFPAAYKDASINAMDEYMKECVIEAFEFIAKHTTGHSIDEQGNVEFKYKNEWISKEALFENFL
jgi:hypothetical protein